MSQGSLTPKTLSDAQRLLESLGSLPQPVERPAFIALSGLPGTGKSYLSRKIARKVPAIILESDAMRKVLFPRPSYDRQESVRLFNACYYVIEKLLGWGKKRHQHYVIDTSRDIVPAVEKIVHKIEIRGAV